MGITASNFLLKAVINRGGEKKGRKTPEVSDEKNRCNMLKAPEDIGISKAVSDVDP